MLALQEAMACNAHAIVDKVANYMAARALANVASTSRAPKLYVNGKSPPYHEGNLRGKVHLCTT